MALHAVVQQHAERAVPEETNAILAAGLVAHVGFADGDQPYVIPMSYHFDPATADRLWLHGATASRLLGHAGTGARVCVAVTLVDALIQSRTAKYHSMNYRSAVVFGRGHEVTDREVKARVFEAMVSRYFPGRTIGRDYAAPPDAHLDATLVVEIVLEAESAKARRGGPKGPNDADEDAWGSAGIVPIPPQE
jgi:nitroimidazol reductase NimA-like FMN-containing flavoprotein (pyridoxamine 5'-phosphate oxidase superfamily)